jgi:DNA-binding CsgD family transcriptional regulator
VLEKISQVYQKQNNAQLALQYKLQSEELEKRLFDNKKSREIAILESKGEWIKREQDVKQQLEQKENTKRNLGIGLVLALIGLSVIGILLRKRHRRIKHLEKVRKNIEQENKRKTEDLSQIQKDLHAQSSALETMAQVLELKNTLIRELEEKVTVSDETATSTVPNDMGLQLRKMKTLTTDDWKRFYDLFDKSFPDFQARLKSNFPSLSPAEIRLFILLKLKLDNAEIAQTLAISIDSVYKSRYRLRKKLGFTDESDWENFIVEF